MPQLRSVSTRLQRVSTTSARVEGEGGKASLRVCDVRPSRVSSDGRACRPKNIAYSEQWVADHAHHLSRRLDRRLQRPSPNGESVLLVGPPGRGKTGIAVLALRRLLQRDTKARMAGYHYVPDLLARLRSFMGDDPTRRSDEDRNSSESLLYAHLMAPQMLMLDDLGAEKPSDWVREQILRILRGRDSLDVGVIVTSNLELEQRKGSRAPSLALYYGTRIVSRLGAYKEIRVPSGMPEVGDRGRKP